VKVHVDPEADALYLRLDDSAVVESEEVHPGIVRQVLDGERQTLVRYVYRPGAVFPAHAHPEEQITAVISGRITFTVAGETVTLGPGEAAVIPPGTPHGATVVGDDAVETLNSLSPRRSTLKHSTRRESFSAKSAHFTRARAMPKPRLIINAKLWL